MLKEIFARILPKKIMAFDAGKSGRRLRAIPTNESAINTLIQKYGKHIVARSRYLCVNNSYAANAKDIYVSALVGDGIKPASLVDDPALKEAIQIAFYDSSDELDADGLADYYGMQTLGAGELFEAGEFFIRRRNRWTSDGLRVPIQFQLLSSEMCPIDKNESLPNDNGRIVCGVEFNKIGKRVAYHFYRNHPGEQTGAFILDRETVRVPASEVIHVYKPVRVGAVRGIPYTLAGLITAAMIDLYDDAELERKRLAALFAAFVTRPNLDEDGNPLGVATTDAATGNESYALEPGVVSELPVGADVRFAEPADVGGNYEAFQYRNLLRMAAGFRVPYSSMTGDLNKGNFGSLRLGELTFRRRITAEQHQIMGFKMCRPMWEMWFGAAVLAGVIPVNLAEYEKDPYKFRRVKHMPPHWDWIDPEKDLKAEVLAVDNGFKSRDDVIEGSGYDPEEVDKRNAAGHERAKRLGLTFRADTNRTRIQEGGGSRSGYNPDGGGQRDQPGQNDSNRRREQEDDDGGTDE